MISNSFSLLVLKTKPCITSLAAVLLPFVLCISCDNEELTQEDEANNLQALFQEIENLAKSVDCTDQFKWDFTAYGSKACGGPVGYIAYSIEIDTTSFLMKVEEHRLKQEAFNTKWGIASDCALALPPDSIECLDGEAVLKYNTTHSENCDENPGCPAPTGQILPLTIVLIDENDEQISISESNIEDIALEAQGVQEVLSVEENKIVIASLSGIFSNNDFLEKVTYTLTTSFGNTQELEITIDWVWADACQWCRNYYISEIILNGEETLFTGEYGDEVSITVKIE